MAPQGGMPTIKASSEIDKIFKEGRRAAHPLVIALVRATPEGRGLDGRVAFVAGKRIGGAVVRNRCKRVLRAAARASGAPWPGKDVVLIARDGTPAAPAADLHRAVSEVTRRAGVAK